MLLSLYLHFPFCKQKCLYCDFVSGVGSPELITSYCNALCTEIRREGEKYRDARVDTVFFGGGTPSLVPAEEMERVLKTLKASFTLLPDAEFTSEANPGTLREDWLGIMGEYGMNRLSLGVQAAQDELLQKIGRIHTVRQAEEAILMARRHGIRNINTDLMYGLPGQSLEDYLASIRQTAEWDVTHLSAYSLILEEGTPLYRQVTEGRVKLPHEDETADMSDAGTELLEQLGYHRYEISNYAQNGYACRHNLGYWHGKHYLGLGVAAHSLLPVPSGAYAYLRRANTEKLGDYLKAAEQEDFSPVRTTQGISRSEAMFENVMLALRTTEGISHREFENAFGIRLKDRYSAAIESLVRDGLAVTDEKGLRLTKRGLDVQNLVSLRLMEADAPEKR